MQRNSKTRENPSVLMSNPDIGHALSGVNRMFSGLALGAIMMVAAGCTVSSGLSPTNSQNEFVTGSVSKPVKTEGIESTDAELIKNAVADADNSRSPEMLAWQNPDTGNKGTITAIDQFVGSHGQQCKKFQTTVDTFMGISLYNGETCELKKGFWVLSWFIRDGS